MPDALDPTLLARTAEEDRARLLREDLEDAMKEYGELDLLVELLQNALDAIDERRYRAVCAAAGLDGANQATIEKWNDAVLEALSSDCDTYEACISMVDKAAYYRDASDDAQRRQQWFERLGTQFGADGTALVTAAAGVRGPLKITVRVGPPHWIEVEDTGVGISDIPLVFRHQSSGKRQTDSRPRRYGIRGSHGWGLTAVLAMSDRLEVVSRTDGSDAAAFVFSDYASFVQRSVAIPRNERLEAADLDGSDLSADIRSNPSRIGTHIRARIAGGDQSNFLGHVLAHFRHDKFVNLLRLYTPVGQVNDYMLHPAFHNLRVNDLDIELTTINDGPPVRTSVPFDFFRLSGRARPSHMDLYSYINAGSPRNKSVHTVHRARRADNVYLSAADVQASSLIHDLEDDLRRDDELPQRLDDAGLTEEGSIPRGFQLALSGGMRSEHLARPPRSTGAAFRGIILSETARPTLGRKHVVDQRQLIARVAAEHEGSQYGYEAIRRSVMPIAEPPPATPAAARWKREFFEGVRSALEGQQPLADTHVWCGRESREARVMIAFGELLALGWFGDMKVLRGHLQDIYDFAFLYQITVRPDSRPNAALASTLAQGGYVILNEVSGVMQRYGIGEFKHDGADILDDFRPDQPRKMPGTPDLVVCWSFSKEAVESFPWTVEDVTPDKAEFEGQTHIWRPNPGEVQRERGLAVVSLSELTSLRVTNGDAASPPAWPDSLPDIYY